jgi:hypothetical protein
MRLPINLALAAALAIAGLSLTASVTPSAAQGARALDVWEVGQLPAGETPLATNLWRNSDAAAVGPMFDKINGPMISPAATRLARAALLTGGGPPQGSEIAAAEAARKRFAALGRLGAADEIAAMTNVSPAAAADPAILTFAAQADLARGRTGDACRRVQNAQGAGATPFILRLRAFCYAANGEDAAADLAIEVARAAGVNDFWLFSALPSLQENPTTAAARYDSSLNATVSVMGKLKGGAKPLLNASALSVGVLARNQETPALLRADAAQTALRAYAIEPRIARDAITPALSVKPTKAAPLPLVATSLNAISAAADPGAKAAAIDTFFKKTPTYGDYVAAARLVIGDVNGLPRDATTAKYALNFARANLALGDARAAASWRDAITLATPTPGENNRAALDVAIAAAGEGGAEMARVMLERRIDLGGASAARDAMVFGALGLASPERAASFIAATPQPKTLKVADANTVAAMVSASQRGASGETAILAAQVLSPGAHMIDRASLVSTIQALRAVGLDAHARQVAIEAMIGPGIG